MQDGHGLRIDELDVGDVEGEGLVPAVALADAVLGGEDAGLQEDADVVVLSLGECADLVVIAEEDAAELEVERGRCDRRCEVGLGRGGALGDCRAGSQREVVELDGAVELGGVDRRAGSIRRGAAGECEYEQMEHPHALGPECRA